MDNRKWFEKASQEGFECFEIYQELSEERRFTWFEGTLDTYVTSHVLGTAFRGVIDGKMVNASTEDTGDEQMGDILASMKQQAAMISSADAADLFNTAQPESSGKKTASFEAAEIKAFLKKAEEKILAADQRIFQVSNLEYSENREKRTIANSYGMNLCDASGMNVIVAGAAARQADEIRTAYEFEPVEDLETFDLDGFVQRLAEKTVSKLGAEIPASGNVPVMIDRQAMTSLFRAFSPMFTGEQIRKGISPLSDRLDSRVFSELITIIDDPSDPSAPRQWLFDDEGCLTKRKEVVAEGVFSTVLHSASTAAKMDTVSTGNGFRRSYGSPVEAVPRNLYIVPGEKTPEELMQEMGNGILITEFAGLHAGLNHVTGDFSLQCGGFMIRDGRKAEGLTLFTAAGNFIDLLSDVKAVANDLKWGVSSAASPAIWFSSLAIAGK